MEDPLPKLVVGTLEQVLAQPALVGYQDSGEYQYLGRFSDAEDESKAKVTLSICRDVETKRKFLIYLHIPFKRPNWKKARGMYLVVPVEDLQLKYDVLRAGDIPQVTPEHLKKYGLASTDNVHRVAMGLGRPAYAVMPSLPKALETPLEGLQCQLLLHWRNLSNHANMEVYLSDSSVTDPLRALSTEARDGQLATPEIDLKNIYHGCRGVINNWEQYPCNENARHLTWNPCLDQDPPPYDDVAPRRPRPDRLSPVDEKCSQRMEIAWGPTSQPADEALTFKDAGHLSRPRKRMATEALGEDFEPPVNASAKGMMIPGTPTEADSSQESASSLFGDASLAEPQWASQAREVEEAIKTSVLRRGNANSRPRCALLKEPHLFLELQEWILKMWNYDPRAHDVYRDQLLNLGLYVRGHMVGRFDRAKAEMQFGFLERSSKMLAVPGWRPSDLGHDARQFQEWLETRICRNAVTLLTGPLRDLHSTTAKVGLLQAVEKSDVEAFFEQKAKCCAMAFMVFGGRV